MKFTYSQARKVIDEGRPMEFNGNLLEPVEALWLLRHHRQDEIERYNKFNEELRPLMHKYSCRLETEVVLSWESIMEIVNKMKRDNLYHMRIEGKPETVKVIVEPRILPWSNEA